MISQPGSLIEEKNLGSSPLLMKILWRKANEREDAQNILSKNLELEKQHQRGIQTENSRAMEAHTQMLRTLNKMIEEAQLCHSNFREATMPHRSTCNKLWRGYMPKLRRPYGDIRSRK